MPCLPAARLGDLHTCPAMIAACAGTGPLTPPCCPAVLVAGRPVARMGDPTTCVGGADLVLLGNPRVLVGGRPVARMGDAITLGGVILNGCFQVFL